MLPLVHINSWFYHLPTYRHCSHLTLWKVLKEPEIDAQISSEILSSGTCQNNVLSSYDGIHYCTEHSILEFCLFVCCPAFVLIDGIMIQRQTQKEEREINSETDTHKKWKIREEQKHVHWKLTLGKPKDSFFFFF